MLQVGVIGCGYWGPNLIRNLSGLDNVCVASVCDSRTERLDFVRQRYPAIGTLTGTARDVLTSTAIDAVVLATPVSTHFELAREALTQGKHVLIEKPFTATVAEGERLIELAEKTNLRLMVDHTFVYTGAVETIRGLIDSGVLGELYYFDSVRVNLGLFQHDVNVIWDLAPHDASIMDYLLGQEPVAVSAIGMAHFDHDLENIAYISAFYPNNLLGHIHVNWLAPVKVRKTLLSGSNKMVIYDDMEPSEKVKVYDRGINFVRERDRIYDILIQYRTGDMLAPNVDLTEALHKVAREFVGSIAEQRAPRTDGLAGLRVVRILEAANSSIKQQGAMIELK